MDLQYVVFQLHTEEYGIDISHVREIVQMQGITKLPHAADFIEGIINLREQVIPIVDLKKRFYGLKTEITDSSRIIVVNAGEHIVGIIADEVSEVLRLTQEMIEPPPQIINKTFSQSGIKGIGKLDKRLLILIDFAEAFSAGEKTQIEKAVS